MVFSFYIENCSLSLFFLSSFCPNKKDASTAKTIRIFPARLHNTFNATCIMCTFYSVASYAFFFCFFFSFNFFICYCLFNIYFYLRLIFNEHFFGFFTWKKNLIYCTLINTIFSPVQMHVQHPKKKKQPFSSYGISSFK